MKYLSLFIALLPLWTFAQTVSVGTLSPTTPYCAGQTLEVPYTVSGGTFNSGNTFTAQLSNQYGSFNSPTNIGTISATESGTIQAQIPFAASNGTGYKVRIVANSPAKTSASTTNFSVTALSITASIVNQTVYCAGDEIEVAFTTNCDFPAGTVFSAQLSLSNGSWNPSLTETPTILGTTVSTGGTGVITAIVPTTYIRFGTGYKLRVIANTAPMRFSNNINNVAIRTAQVHSSTYSFCAGSDTKLEAKVLSAPSGVSYSYQWFSGNDAVGTNSNSYWANSVADYKVHVIPSDGSCVAVSEYKSVTERPLPVIDGMLVNGVQHVSGDVIVCENDVVSLEVLSADAVSYQWFVNSGPRAGETGTTYSQAITGTTNISARVTGDNGCNSSYNVRFIANPIPKANFTLSAETVLANDEVSIATVGTNANAATAVWTMTGSSLPSFTGAGNALPPSFSYGSGGSYTITRTVTYTGTGCSASGSKTIWVEQPPVGMSFSVCADGTIQTWGSDQDGQLGHGITNDFGFAGTLIQTIPTTYDVVADFNFVTPGSIALGTEVMTVRTGGAGTIAILSDGSAVMWGSKYTNLNYVRYVLQNGKSILEGSVGACVITLTDEDGRSYAISAPLSASSCNVPPANTFPDTLPIPRATKLIVGQIGTSAVGQSYCSFSSGLFQAAVSFNNQLGCVKKMSNISSDFGNTPYITCLNEVQVYNHITNGVTTLNGLPQNEIPLDVTITSNLVVVLTESGKLYMGVNPNGIVVPIPVCISFPNNQLVHVNPNNPIINPVSIYSAGAAFFVVNEQGMTYAFGRNIFGDLGIGSTIPSVVCDDLIQPLNLCPARFAEIVTTQQGNCSFGFSLLTNWANNATKWAVSWEFEDGFPATATGITTPTVTFSGSNTKFITVTIRDVNTNRVVKRMQTCVQPQSLEIPTIISSNSTLTCNATTTCCAVATTCSTTVCQGTNLTAQTNQTGISFSWNNGLSTAPNLFVTESGIYSVELVNNEGCSSEPISVQVTVNPLPFVELEATNGVITCADPTDCLLTVCDNTTLTAVSPTATEFLWSNNEPMQSITITAGGDFSVMVTDANGCTAQSANVNVTFETPATPTIIGETEICAGETTTLTAQPAGLTDYLWSNGATTPSITVSQAGAFSVRVIVNGCTSEVSQPTTVTVNPLPFVELEAANGVITCVDPTDCLLTVCDNTTLTAVSPTATEFLWSNNETTQNITITAGGDFSVIVTDANGCTAQSANVNVTVFETPLPPTIDGDNCFVEGDKGYTFSVQNPEGQVIWTLNGTPQPNGNSLFIQQAAIGDVITAQIVANGCTSETAEITIQNCCPQAQEFTVEWIEQPNTLIYLNGLATYRLLVSNNSGLSVNGIDFTLPAVFSGLTDIRLFVNGTLIDVTNSVPFTWEIPNTIPAGGSIEVAVVGRYTQLTPQGTNFSTCFDWAIECGLEGNICSNSSRVVTGCPAGLSGFGIGCNEDFTNPVPFYTYLSVHNVVQNVKKLEITMRYNEPLLGFNELAVNNAENAAFSLDGSYTQGGYTITKQDIIPNEVVKYTLEVTEIISQTNSNIKAFSLSTPINNEPTVDLNAWILRFPFLITAAPTQLPNYRNIDVLQLRFTKADNSVQSLPTDFAVVEFVGCSFDQNNLNPDFTPVEGIVGTPLTFTAAQTASDAVHFWIVGGEGQQTMEGGEFMIGDGEFTKTFDVAGVYPVKHQLFLNNSSASVVKLVRIIDGGGARVGKPQPNQEYAFNEAALSADAVPVDIFPNPYSDKVQIRYELPEDASTELFVTDLMGRKVAHLHQGLQVKGQHRFEFSAGATGKAKGIYLLHLRVNGKLQLYKLIEN